MGLNRVGVLFDGLIGFLVDRFLRLLLMLSLTGSMLVGFGLFCWTIGLGRLWPFKSWKVLNGFRQVG